MHCLGFVLEAERLFVVYAQALIIQWVYSTAVDQGHERVCALFLEEINHLFDDIGPKKTLLTTAWKDDFDVINSDSDSDSDSDSNVNAEPAVQPVRKRQRLDLNGVCLH